MVGRLAAVILAPARRRDEDPARNLPRSEPKLPILFSQQGQIDRGKIIAFRSAGYRRRGGLIQHRPAMSLVLALTDDLQNVPCSALDEAKPAFDQCDLRAIDRPTSVRSSGEKEAMRSAAASKCLAVAFHDQLDDG